MKPKHIFWGLLFITIGLLILLNNLGSLEIDLYDYWKFWPLVLIILGLSFLINNNWIKGFLAAISGIIFAVALYSLFTSAFQFVGNRFEINDNGIQFSNNENNNDTAYYSEPYKSNIKNAEFDFDANAGKFRIADTTEQLFEATTRGFQHNYKLSADTDNGNAVVKFKMRKGKIFLNDHKNIAIIKLNSRPEWNMNFKSGAASLDFDLSKFKTNNVNVDMGAASMRIKLGDKLDVSNVVVHAGVSSIIIDVPFSVGCEINAKVSLSSKHFEDFQKLNNKLYRTADFDSAKKKIFITVESGVSSVTVNRYSKEW